MKKLLPFLLSLSLFADLYRYRFEEQTFSNEVLWEQTNLPPFNELILSWNGTRPSDGRLVFLISIQQDEKWGPWLYYAEWGSWGQMLFLDFPPNQSTESTRDKIKIKKGFAQGFRIRPLASGGATLASLKTLFVNTADMAHWQPCLSPKRPLDAVLLSPVPHQSQITLRHPRSSDLSLPTAATTALSYLLHPSKVDRHGFFRQIIDDESDFYESWILNCAECSNRLGETCETYVTRLADFELIHASLKEGFPVLAATRGYIVNGPRSYYTEHTLCIIGYNPETQTVQCIDSGFPSDRATFVSYPLADFLVAWGKQGNMVCLFKKRLRGCLQSEGSSLLGIILADFRFFFRGEYQRSYMPPEKRIEKSAQKNPKIDRTSLCRHPLILLNETDPIAHRAFFY